jgi:hypothetical protein
VSESLDTTRLDRSRQRAPVIDQLCGVQCGWRAGRIEVGPPQLLERLEGREVYGESRAAERLRRPDAPKVLDGFADRIEVGVECWQCDQLRFDRSRGRAEPCVRGAAPRYSMRAAASTARLAASVVSRVQRRR